MTEPNVRWEEEERKREGGKEGLASFGSSICQGIDVVKFAFVVCFSHVYTGYHYHYVAVLLLILLVRSTKYVGTTYRETSWTGFQFFILTTIIILVYFLSLLYLLPPSHLSLSHLYLVEGDKKEGDTEHTYLCSVPRKEKITDRQPGVYGRSAATASTAGTETGRNKGKGRKKDGRGRYEQEEEEDKRDRKAREKKEKILLIDGLYGESARAELISIIIIISRRVSILGDCVGCLYSVRSTLVPRACNPPVSRVRSGPP